MNGNGNSPLSVNSNISNTIFTDALTPIGSASAKTASTQSVVTKYGNPLLPYTPPTFISQIPSNSNSMAGSSLNQQVASFPNTQSMSSQSQTQSPNTFQTQTTQTPVFQTQTQAPVFQTQTQTQTQNPMFQTQSQQQNPVPQTQFQASDNQSGLKAIYNNIAAYAPTSSSNSNTGYQP